MNVSNKHFTDSSFEKCESLLATHRSIPNAVTDVLFRLLAPIYRSSILIIGETGQKMCFFKVSRIGVGEMLAKHPFRYNQNPETARITTVSRIDTFDDHPAGTTQFGNRGLLA
jgi:hypothetical protein